MLIADNLELHHPEFLNGSSKLHDTYWNLHWKHDSPVDYRVSSEASDVKYPITLGY